MAVGKDCGGVDLVAVVVVARAVGGLGAAVVVRVRDSQGCGQQDGTVLGIFHGGRQAEIDGCRLRRVPIFGVAGARRDAVTDQSGPWVSQAAALASDVLVYSTTRSIAEKS